MIDPGASSGMEDHQSSLSWEQKVDEWKLLPVFEVIEREHLVKTVRIFPSMSYSEETSAMKTAKHDVVSTVGFGPLSLKLQAVNRLWEG